MNRLLTVFVPTFNGLPYLKEAIGSLLAQTHRDFELMILDDGSTDGTPDAIESCDDPRISVHRGNGNRGAGGNWNRALEMAQTPYLAICHQDDVYEPRFLEVLVDLLIQHPRAFLAHCKAKTINATGGAASAPADIYKEHFWPIDDPYERCGRDELEVLRRGSYIVTSAVVYRTSAVRQIGLFRTDYRQSLDWDYWLRGVLADFSVVGTHQRLMRYRRHPRMATVRSEADLVRYHEEVDVLRRFAETAFAVGLASSPRPNYRIVTDTMLSELARRLASRDRRASAGDLLSFAEQTIPQFAGSPKHRLAQGAYALGRLGGALLHFTQFLYFAALRLRRWGLTRLYRTQPPIRRVPARTN